MSHNFCLNENHVGGWREFCGPQHGPECSCKQCVQKFTGNTSQRNWSVVFSQNSVAFLENCRNAAEVRETCIMLHFFALNFMPHVDPQSIRASKSLCMSIWS